MTAMAMPQNNRSNDQEQSTCKRIGTNSRFCGECENMTVTSILLAVPTNDYSVLEKVKIITNLYHKSVLSFAVASLSWLLKIPNDKYGAWLIESTLALSKVQNISFIDLILRD